MSMKPGRNGRGNLIHLILFFRFENGKSLFNPETSSFMLASTLKFLPLVEDPAPVAGIGEVRWG